MQQGGLYFPMRTGRVCRSGTISISGDGRVPCPAPTFLIEETMTSHTIAKFQEPVALSVRRRLVQAHGLIRSFRYNDCRWTFDAKILAFPCKCTRSMLRIEFPSFCYSWTCFQVLGPSVLTTRVYSMAELSEYILEPLREAADFTLYRDKERGNQMPILAVLSQAHQRGLIRGPAGLVRVAARSRDFG
jgi:hypothetical protein